MRLIDANALVEFAREGIEKTKPEGARMLLTFLRNMVELQPTVDAVPVIRCKDCKYRITANCERFGIKRYTQSDSFCSWAERRGEGKCGSD